MKQIVYLFDMTIPKGKNREKGENHMSKKKTNEFTRIKVIVSVGYGWQKFNVDDREHLSGHEVLADEFWRTLRKKFEHNSFRIVRGDKVIEVEVEVQRLRGTHGSEIWATVQRKIAKADVLIFDIAAAIDPSRIKDSVGGEDISKLINGFNHNVLVETGVALGRDKKVLLLCPRDLFNQIPSDLRGYLWSLYTLEKKKGKRGGELERKFLDEYGLNAAYMSMLKSAALAKLEKLGVIEKSDEEEND